MKITNPKTLMDDYRDLIKERVNKMDRRTICLWRGCRTINKTGSLFCMKHQVHACNNFDDMLEALSYCRDAMYDLREYAKAYVNEGRVTQLTALIDMADKAIAKAETRSE